MSGTLKDGYYNVVENPAESMCWRLVGEKLLFVRKNGEELSSHGWTIRDIHSGDLVPSLWLPPGVTHNPAMGLEPTCKAVPFDPDPFDSEPTPESLDDHEAASRFVNLEAMEAVSYIALACSWKADDQVRRVFTTPSQLDRAIAARVVELLS